MYIERKVKKLFSVVAMNRLSVLPLFFLTLVSCLSFMSCLKSDPEKIVALQKTEIEAALRLFASDVGRYPTTDEGLDALFTDSGIEGWNGPYVTKKGESVTKAFDYRCPGENGKRYSLTSKKDFP